MKKFIFLFYFVSFLGSAQEHQKENSILKSFRGYKIIEAENLLRTLENKRIKSLLNIELRKLKTGSLDTTLLFSYNAKETKLLSPKEKTIYYYLFGDAILQYKENDSLAYLTYNKALEIAKNNKDWTGVNHVLNKKNHLLFKNGKEINLFKKTMQEYKRYAKNNVDKFWSQYYFIVWRFYDIQKLEIANNEISLDKEFEKGYAFADNEYLKAVLHQLQGIYFDIFKNDLINAKRQYKIAKEAYLKHQFIDAKMGLFSVNFNLGIIEYRNNEYNNSIKIFRNSLQNFKTSHRGKIDLMFINEWLYKSYEKIEKYDSAYYYFKNMGILKDKLNQLKHAKGILAIDKKYNVDEKVKELEILSSKHKSLKTQMLTLLPIFGLLTIILIIVYFLYKRYKNKNSILVEEQSQTLQKIDELKNIVIKNHIVLKDGTKIYVADLLYIKSDDHYLNLFLSNGKNHFVRGKLIAIIEQLPPNFIRCHRSYIVNVNFVKQTNPTFFILTDKSEIPISRSFQNEI